jgi:hypothetical protein
MGARPWIVPVTADQHTNSSIGLCPGEGVKLDDGGIYQPSKAQRWLWDAWLDFHAKVAALRARLKARMCYVVNGDSHDGDHHQTTQIITRNEECRAYIAQRVFGVVRDLKPDLTLVTRGTTAHVGGGAAADEQIGKFLHAARDEETDAWSSWHHRLQLHGLRLDFKHHTSVGGLPWTAPGGVARLAFRIRWEYLDRGLPAPDLAIRSHKHVFYDSGDAHKTRAIVTPAWQLKTEFVHQVAPESIADIGGVVIVIWPDGRYEVQRHLYQPALPTERVA